METNEEMPAASAPVTGETKVLDMPGARRRRIQNAAMLVGAFAIAALGAAWIYGLGLL